jgi:hypothetical protein
LVVSAELLDEREVGLRYTEAVLGSPPPTAAAASLSSTHLALTGLFSADFAVDEPLAVCVAAALAVADFITALPGLRCLNATRKNATDDKSSRL